MKRKANDAGLEDSSGENTNTGKLALTELQIQLRDAILLLTTKRGTQKSC